MRTYSTGDKVILAHQDTEYGHYGIVDHAHWGAMYTVADGYRDSTNFVIIGHGRVYAVHSPMVEPMGGPW